MTEQANASVELAIKEEIAQLSGFDEYTVDHIQGDLEELYAVAQANNDENSMAVIGATWDKVSALHLAGVGLMEIAAATKASLQEAIEQRDQFAEEVKAIEEERDDLLGERDYAYEQLTDLKNDLRDPWSSKSKEVGDLVTMVEEAAYDGFYENMDSSEFEDDIYSSLQYEAGERLQGIGVGSKKADEFADIILNDFYMDRLPAERKAELRDFIERFIVIEESNS